MASIGKYVAPALACIGLSGACASEDNNSCDLGAATGCVPENNGPREYRYCQVDETWSECTPEVLCDPLAQTGCPEGLVCYLASLSTAVCAPAETLPCSPSQSWGRGIEGTGCQPMCVSEPGTLNEDPEHCAEGEVCLRAGLPYDVGQCYTPTDDLGEGMAIRTEGR